MCACVHVCVCVCVWVCENPFSPRAIVVVFFSFGVINFVNDSYKLCMRVCMCLVYRCYCCAAIAVHSIVFYFVRWCDIELMLTVAIFKIHFPFNDPIFGVRNVFFLGINIIKTYKLQCVTVHNVYHLSVYQNHGTLFCCWCWWWCLKKAILLYHFCFTFLHFLLLLLLLLLLFICFHD